MTEVATPDPTGDPDRAMTALLMPVPSKPLAVGETETTTFSMPNSLGGSNAPLTGPMTLTFVGYDQAQARRCARLDTTIRLQATAGGMTAKVAMNGRACIDPTDGMVVTSTLDATMEVSGAGQAMTMTTTLELART
jgi:hypothetical protein